MVLATTAAGCQTHSMLTSRRLVEHRAGIDSDGLKAVEVYQAVCASAAPPQSWDRLSLTRSGPVVHQQWRSPSRNTGVGVAYVRLPLPLTARALIWIARQRYTSQSNDGKLIGQWTDALGRPWFEAENNQYHVRGYAVTRGFDAWFVYFGYKTRSTPDAAELALAARAMETIVPTDLHPQTASAAPVSAAPTKQRSAEE